MSVLLPRFHRRELERSRHRDDKHGPILVGSHAVEEAVRQAVDTTTTVARATLPGDNRRLRGIPVCSFGVGGVSPGTDPYAETARRWGR